MLFNLQNIFAKGMYQPRFRRIFKEKLQVEIYYGKSVDNPQILKQHQKIYIGRGDAS